MEKKTYNTPEMEILYFEVGDVILTSDPELPWHLLDEEDIDL